MVISGWSQKDDSHAAVQIRKELDYKVAMAKLGIAASNENDTKHFAGI